MGSINDKKLIKKLVKKLVKQTTKKLKLDVGLNQYLAKEEWVTLDILPQYRFKNLRIVEVSGPDLNEQDLEMTITLKVDDFTKPNEDESDNSRQ